MANQSETTHVHERDLGTMVEKAKGQLEDYAGDARRRIDDLDRRVTDAVQENPLLVLGIAVGVGYVIGRVVSRLR
ncbi:MAG: glycine zipper domain-containing protein [Polyangiales bacterium]